MSTRPIPSQTTQSLKTALTYLIPLAVFTKVAIDITEHETTAYDNQILTWLHHLASPGLNGVAITVTNLGSPQVIITATVALAITLYIRHQRRNMAILLSGLGGAALLNVILKIIFSRHRPTLWKSVLPETDFSFPSGHAMLSSALILCLIYILWPTKWRAAAIVAGIAYVLAVGLSRLYLGVHFPSDIIGGWSLSLFWVAVVVAIFNRTAVKQPAKPSSEH